MSVWLVCDDSGLQLPLLLQPRTRERLEALIAGANASPPTIDSTALASQLAETIEASLARHALPPSEKQISYAVAIAQGLNLELPAQALQDRNVMHIFIAAHADEFRAKRRPLAVFTPPMPFK